MKSNSESPQTTQAGAIGRHQVFLVQGYTQGEGGEPGGALEQRVYVAPDDDALRDYFSRNSTGDRFVPLGWASLAEYEDAARLIRVALKGEGDCLVTVVPGQ